MLRCAKHKNVLTKCKDRLSRAGQDCEGIKTLTKRTQVGQQGAWQRALSTAGQLNRIGANFVRAF
jgi:hypothetical protein